MFILIIFIIAFVLESLATVFVATLVQRKRKEGVCFISRHLIDTLFLITFRWSFCSEGINKRFCYCRCERAKVISKPLVIPILNEFIKIVRRLKDVLLPFNRRRKG